MPRPFALLLLLLIAIGSTVGCGTIKGRTATEQLLVSDAVDQSIEQIDFGPLSGEDVYLDSSYVRAVRGVGFVNSEYIISSLRQRLITANCRLQEKADDAKYIVEVRVGALGSDCHEVNYGVPGSQALNQTAALVANAPLPAVPEISLARTDNCRAAAKISLFAYQRESRAPAWESGPVQGVSLAKSTWILGAGPFQKGSIYSNSDSLQTKPLEFSDPAFDGAVIAFLKKPLFKRQPASSTAETPRKMLATTKEHPRLRRKSDVESIDSKASKVVQASATQPVEASSE